MTSPPTPFLHERRAAPVTARERSVVALTLAGIVAFLFAAGGEILWTRPLWFDEICCTLFVVEGASSPLDVVRRVARGEDYAPPLLHLMVWASGRIAGGVTPIVLRTMSLACVCGALFLLYSALRRSFERAPSAAGVLAVASHALVVAHAFEGRYYGPWILFASTFAWTLGMDGGAARSSRRNIAQSIASIFLATIHWFGVLSLALMCGAAVLARGGSWRERLRFIAPSVAGFIAFFACLPLVLTHRASALEIDALWIPGLSAAQLGVIVRLFFLSTVPVLGVVLLLVDALREPGPKPSVGSSLRHALRDPSMAALASLALFPAVLVLVSLVLQPSMLDRYAILTVLAWAPLVALAVTSLNGAARIVVVLFVAALVALAGRRAVAEKREFAAMARLNAEAYAQALTMNRPIVFASLHTAYPVAGPRRKERRALFVELPDSTIQEMIPQPRLGWLRRHVMVERNIARGHARTYGFPVLVSQSQLDTISSFVLVGPDESFPRLYKRFDLFVGKVFPRHRGRRLTPNLALLEREAP